MLSASEMLDQLMGGERDVALDKRTNKTKQFDEPDVCKHFLCGICPYDIFKATKSDIGVCRSACTDAFELKACKVQWEALPQEEKDKHGYEHDLYLLLEDLIRTLDRKIAETKSRMEMDDKQNERVYGKNSDREEEKKVLLAKVEELNAQAEAAGDEGDVEKAMALMEQTKALNEQAEEVAAEIKKNAKREGAEKKLRVCDVCGVKIEMNPLSGEERVNAHLTGKQYKGWLATREKFAELKALHGGAGPARPSGRGGRGGGGGPSPREYDSRDPDRGYGGGGGDRGYGGGGGGGGYGGRDDSRGGGGGGNRDRRDDRDRGRDRDRDRGGRDRDWRRDRDRDRGRDRDRDRRSRSRS